MDRNRITFNHICFSAVKLAGLVVLLAVWGFPAQARHCTLVSTNAADPVRRVDYSEVPEMQGLAERTRRVGNEMYPKVCALLAEDSSKPPKHFDIVLRKHVAVRAHGMGMSNGYVSGTTVCLDAHFLEQNSNDLVAMLVHEMAHVAQQYRITLWGVSIWTRAPFYWEEGIADYACQKLVYTNGWNCPPCSAQFPHYTSGYSCAAAFLMYVETGHGSNVVRRLNSELRRGSYSDKFFARATGKNLDALWTEFEKTPVFTPVALGLNRLCEALGYVDGKPPRDIDARFEFYLQQHPEMRRVDEAFRYVSGKPPRDMQDRFTLYLMFQQPLGALTLEATKFLTRLKKNGQLPGWLENDHGQMSGGTLEEANPVTFPVSRTFDLKKNGEAGNFHYTVIRLSRDGNWKLQRAWRTGADGRILEEYSVP